MLETNEYQPTNAVEVARGEHWHSEYEASGYVACVSHDGATAYIWNYGHCSCYGTWSDGAGKEIWEGTTGELVAMARRDADPHNPERAREPGDFDSETVSGMWAGVLRWDMEGRSLAPEKK